MLNLVQHLIYKDSETSLPTVRQVQSDRFCFVLTLNQARTQKASSRWPIHLRVRRIGNSSIHHKGEANHNYPGYGQDERHIYEGDHPGFDKTQEIALLVKMLNRQEQVNEGR